MILSTSQPYFSPFPGFFLKAFLSDIFVILDEVQFPMGTTWLTRNRFKNDQGTLWMTVPVWKKGLGLQKINEGFNRVFVGNIFYKNLYPFFSCCKTVSRYFKEDQGKNLRTYTNYCTSKSKLE